MLAFKKPTPAAIQGFLDRAGATPYSYPHTGCTQGSVPRRFFVDRYRVPLGQGREFFLAACAALSRWDMMRLGWVEPYPRGTAITAGQTTAVLIRVLGLWWLNAARIVYVHDRQASGREWGFAYGTLADHAERGEERFWIRWDQDDHVYYEIVAISQPARWYTWIGLPLVRRLQRRFAAHSQQAMQRAVQPR